MPNNPVPLWQLQVDVAALLWGYAYGRPKLKLLQQELSLNEGATEYLQRTLAATPNLYYPVEGIWPNLAILLPYKGIYYNQFLGLDI